MAAARAPVIDADLRFGEADLGGAFAPPEQGYAWSLGDRSTVLLRCAPDSSARLLLLEGHPYLHEPELIAQRLRVIVNGERLADWRLDEQFLQCIELPAGLVRDGRAELTFEHPDHARPSRFGGADHRRLAFRFRRATLFLYKTVPDSPLALLNDAGEKAQLGYLAQSTDRLPLEAALCRAIVSGEATAIDSSDQISLQCMSAALRHGLVQAATRLLRLAHNNADIAAEFDAAGVTDLLTVRVTWLAGGAVRLGFHPAIGRAATNGVGLENLVARRALEASALLLRYAQRPGVIGSCLLNLGDDASSRGLALCESPSMHRVLIPDTDFLRTRGYAGERGHATLPWSDRRDVALWRGGISGCHSEELSAWPRWKLCALSRRSAAIDAAFAELQWMRPEQAAAIREAGLEGEYVPPHRFQECKYQIDIDGNTNAWSGLFRKLLSGSVVLKVASVARYRQWYYERMQPWREFVPVRHDLADLEDKVAMLRANDARAREIGEAGRRLALSMTYESEMDWAMPRVETAICEEARTSRPDQ